MSNDGTLFEVTPPGYDWDAYDRRITAANERRVGLRIPTSVDLYWQEQAAWWINNLTSRGEIITADNLIAEIGLPTGTPNQVGARFRHWHMAGLIEPVGYVPSTRKAAHGRAVRSWRVTR